MEPIVIYVIMPDYTYDDPVSAHYTEDAAYEEANRLHALDGQLYAVVEVPLS